MSGEPTTRLLSRVYMLSIVVLMDYHHNRNKDDVERVVMHSRVTLNSYNVNAQVETSTKDSYKEKTLMEKICSDACFAQKGS
jgi:hypothetical protein